MTRDLATVARCLLVAAAAACTEAGPDLASEALPARLGAPSAPPDGYLFAVNGTHVERCVGKTCPTLWALDPSPNNCGGGFEPAEAYIVHQRGADWDGVEGEAELHGHAYLLTDRVMAYPPPGAALPGTVRTRHGQSVILQCCEAEPLRIVRPAAFIDMKVCPDPCDAADGFCPMTTVLGPDSQTFGKCKTINSRWLLETDRCDLEVVDAGWRDPHAPHQLTDRSDDDRRDDDKRVFDVYYRAAWTCGDGICDLGEAGSCASDC